MLSFFLKWLPLLTIAAGTAAAAERLKPVLDYSRVVAVQVEVNEITRGLARDNFNGSVPDASAFADYLRKNMHVTGEAHDAALDYWGTPYLLEMPHHQMKVVSAGPDRRFGTGDDIYSATHL